MLSYGKELELEPRLLSESNVIKSDLSCVYQRRREFSSSAHERKIKYKYITHAVKREVKAFSSQSRGTRNNAEKSGFVRNSIWESFKVSSNLIGCHAKVVTNTRDVKTFADVRRVQHTETNHVQMETKKK